ncbi:sigma-54-dependent transcriptional regulator [Occallatibacter riparius]|uniref:sigma-54-dependent transcriptional regulator n=1 Tax=Occallatibacter riparius TaxID=1002689 RepID=UPI0028C48725|nr:sigma-54 dependent transcriptional regulator [Occallatibacter riparius]
MVADDQPHILEAVELLLQPQGIIVDCVRSPQLALEALGQTDYDVLLIDLNYTRDTTSGQEGLDLLARIQEMDSRLPVIVMTAWGNIDLAVESMKRGARDFIQKPWENERLISLIKVHAELHQALRRARQLELENRLLRAEGMPEFVASAPSMQPVLELIAQVGPSDANVLITGEHGTGKEIVAKLLHAASPRSRMPLVAVNAGGLPEGTFESEIFGHVKGAFTDARTDRIGRFELANNGTLFLDEIANVPMRQQAKLLRVLETGELERVGSSQTRRVDVRVLSATNAQLHEEAVAGNFREDLLFRLNTVEIHLPALRDRREDIPLLAVHFLNRSRARYRKQVTGFSSAAMQQMMQYAWPGNVRELEHTVERAILLCRTDEIDPSNLAISTARATTPSFDNMSIDEVEALLIRKVLRRCDGNISQAADVLGLSRAALYRRIEKYGL